MLERELSSSKNYETYVEFPVMIFKPEMVLYHLPEAPSHFNEEYLIQLFEYFKGKKVLRFKHQRIWRKGQTISFDPVKDYSLQDNKEYCLTTTINIQNIGEVFDYVFYKIR